MPRQWIKWTLLLSFCSIVLAAGPTSQPATAPTDSAAESGLPSPLKGLTPKDSDPFADIDTSHTAIYDILAHKVYLPTAQFGPALDGSGQATDSRRRRIISSA